MVTRKRKGRAVSGFLLLDKPKGLTSNRALMRAKAIYDAAKAGHCGSLDPIATGMLPVCFGNATKVSRFLLEATKSYLVVAHMGIETDTGDADGRVISRSDKHVDETAFRTALTQMRGQQAQVPPMYSALKHEGRRLYSLARAGIEVERAPRRVTIHEALLESYAFPRATFRIMCSKGTYIRSLVTDLARALGSVAHVAELRRLTVGPFGATPMWTLDALEELARQGPEALDALLLPVDAVLTTWPLIVLDPPSARRIRQGQKLDVGQEPAVGWHRMYTQAGSFIGMGEVAEDGTLAPRRIVVE